MDQDSSNTINIIVTGDFSLTGRIEEMCNTNSFSGMYGNLLPLLLNKDISITNLECPLTDALSPAVKSGPTLRASEKSIFAVKHGGFDVCALANNHIMDQGAIGLARTITVCNSAGIKTVGAGENLEAAGKPLYIKIKGRMVAIVNVAEREFCIATEHAAGANPLDPIDNYHQILEAKKFADIVLVIIHGGNEYYPLPSPRMVKTYRFFADLGVTAVVGHHTHCASGYEVYKGVPIFYSLGNFVYDWAKNRRDDWHEGYFVKLKINGNGCVNYSLHPYVQCKDQACLTTMQGEKYQKFMDKIQKLSETIADVKALEEKWVEFCKSRSMQYMQVMLSFGKVGGKLFQLGLYKGPRTRRDRLLRLLNLFRCQAHKDASIGVLEEWLGHEGD